MSTRVDLPAAYRDCEEITWTQARNFSYGIRLLPPAKRRGLAAVYAFARRIDDIGDGTLPAEQKLAALEAARRAGPRTEPIRTPAGTRSCIALADAGGTFPIPLAAFGELIDGCEADVRGTSYATFDDLQHYCRCVAGSIGRLSLGVFGTRDVTDRGAAGRRARRGPPADQHPAGHPRGLRHRPGLPARRGLRRFGCRPEADRLGAGRPRPPSWPRLVEFEADRARDWYAPGLRLMPLLDRRSAACTGAMAGIYYRLLESIAAGPPPCSTAGFPVGREKATVAAKALAGEARGGAPPLSRDTPPAGTWP